MTLITRKPTGLPAWPMLLAAGMPSAGKSDMCARASASPLVSQTYWVGYGEKDPDEFLQIPGADFVIVQHDGTIRGVVSVLEEIASLPVPDAGPALIVVDSGSRIWGVIGEEVRAAKPGRSSDDTTSDLWTDGKGDWQRMLNALRRHKGPSIMTARLQETIIHSEGRPTKDKAWHVTAERDIRYDVDVVVEMRTRGEFLLTKANSETLQFDGPRDLGADFTVDALWRQMGLGGKTGERTFTVPVVQVHESQDKSGRNWLVELAGCVSSAQVAKLGAEAATAKADTEITAAIRKRFSQLSPTPPAATPAAGQPKKKGK